MVSPDQKIDSNRETSAVRSAQGDQKRKPPTRDFQEVAEQVDEKRYREEEEEEGITHTKKRSRAPAIGKGIPKEQHLTLFDLARGAKDAAEEKQSSDSDELDEINKEKPVKNKKSFDVDKETEISKDTPRTAVYGVVEQPDLSTVNPLMAAPPTSYTSSIAKEAHLVTLPRSMQEMIDQIAKAVYIIEQKGTRETIIPLKGAFEGSHVIITEFDSANREMNITIDNLTGSNQRLLDAHKNTLVDELGKKDIVVHIFRATTTIENNVRLEAELGDQGSQSNMNQDKEQSKEKRQK